ncbi:MAG TPA: ATP-binding protein [Blastocatellia bacterium]|jgi:signal transduction histidine kinase/ActR/RegA family two-component response regulator
MALNLSNTLSLVALMFASILLLDRILPAGVCVSILYVIPILLTFRTGSSRLLFATTLLAVLATLVDLLLEDGPVIWSSGMVSALAQLATALLAHVQLKGNERTDAERGRLALLHQTENARLISSLNKQRERLERINEIGQVFASTLDLGSIYLAIREKLGEVVDCDSMLISFYDDETETIRCEFAYTDGKVIESGRFEPLKLGKGPHSQCIRTGKPVIVDDIARRAPGTYRYIGDSEEYPVSIIYVPMVAKERVIGVLQAQSLREGAYCEEDVPLLSIIAKLAASAIENARLYRDAVEGRLAMEHANRVKEEFLATLSHELRTPLTPILGWTRILRLLGENERETLTRGLKVIERNARLQAQLVNDLLDVSRIESGKVSIYAQPTALNAAVSAVVDSIRSEAEESGISIDCSLDEGDISVLADPARLQQIITNLLTNAVKFTGAGGNVTITTAQSNGRGVVRVRDTGAGIEKDFLPHVFERFRQADGSTSRKHGGLGLGLSIVKSLVELHGGQVQAQSDGPGTGATFTVQLPLAAIAAAEPSPRLAAANAGSAQKLRLLVVEDDADTLEMMKVICGSRRLRVTGAATGEEAMARLQREGFDIIISDISLPQMSGLEFAREVRAGIKINSIPMIAMTGLSSEQDRLRAIEAGYDAYIQKPIDYTRLFETIDELTKSRVAAGE